MIYVCPRAQSYYLVDNQLRNDELISYEELIQKYIEIHMKGVEPMLKTMYEVVKTHYSKILTEESS